MRHTPWLTEDQSREITGIQSEAEARTKAKKLPKWVKCMYCGERPRLDDFLGEVIPHSSALAHQSCMAERGKVFGLNAGLTTDLTKETSNDPA